MPCCIPSSASIPLLAYKFLVSKETVVLRRWESETGKFGFITRVDKDRESAVSSVSPSSERIEELWVLLVFVRVWRSFAIGGNMIT